MTDRADNLDVESWKEDLERLKDATAKQSQAKDLLIEKQQEKMETLKRER
jgi:hypothetical protein